MCKIILQLCMIFWKYSCILPKKKALGYGYKMRKANL